MEGVILWGWRSLGGLAEKAQDPLATWVDIPLDIMAIVRLLVIPLVWPWAKGGPFKDGEAGSVP